MLAVRLLSCSLTAPGPCQKAQRAVEGQEKAGRGRRQPRFRLLAAQHRFGWQATRQTAEEASFHLVQQGNDVLSYTNGECGS